MKTFLDYGIKIRHGSSGNVKTLCPQCSHTRSKGRNDPCLSVNIDEGIWNCHHCGWAGTLRAGGYVPRTREYVRPVEKNDTELSDKAKKWLNERGITDEVIKANRLYSDDVWFPQTRDYQSAICFPYYKGTDLINIKSRSGRKHFCFVKDAELCLYGLNNIKAGQEIAIVEGEIDKLTLEVAGIPVVSVPNGAHKDRNNLDFLADIADFEDMKWVLATDSDAPGEALRDELARRLGKEHCRFVEWPEDCKDANDVLQNKGKVALKSLFTDAKKYPIKGIIEPNELADKVLERKALDPGLTTGWNKLDEYIRVKWGQFWVVTGIPNSGKSNFVDALCVNLAEEHDANIAMFTPENLPLENHLTRLAELYNAEKEKNISDATLKATIDWLDHRFCYIMPENDEDWNLETLLKLAKTQVVRRGIKTLVIDPWNELEHYRDRAESETEYISRCLKRLRNFGRSHDVLVIVVAHPSKLYRDKEGNYPVPTLYDISGSAHWRNKADNGICIWRNLGQQEPAVFVHVQKVRLKETGKLGVADLFYSYRYGGYEEEPEVRYADPA